MPDINENRPGYKKTKVGWIPEEWEMTHIGEVVNKLEAGVSVNSTDEQVKDDNEIGILLIVTFCVAK